MTRSRPYKHLQTALEKSQADTIHTSAGRTGGSQLAARCWRASVSWARTGLKAAATGAASASVTKLRSLRRAKSRTHSASTEPAGGAGGGVGCGTVLASSGGRRVYQ